MSFSVSDIKPCYNDQQQITSLSFKLRHDGYPISEIELKRSHDLIASTEPITFHKLAYYVIERYNKYHSRGGQVSPGLDRVTINSFKPPAWFESLFDIAVSDIRSNFLRGADLDTLDAVVLRGNGLRFVFTASRTDKYLFHEYGDCSAELTLDDLSKNEAALRTKINEDLSRYVMDPVLSDTLFQAMMPYITFYKALNEVK